ncbi:MAG: response regulator [Bacteroidota bacterium]
MKTILIIEDNADIRENTAEILSLADYRVLTAANGKEGVTLAKQDKPDLILCDIMMPELDGYGVLRILGSHPETDQIPFIFLTAKSEKEDFRKGMNLGADDYLTKPFDDLSLLDAIELRLRKSERLRTETAPSSPDLPLTRGLEELNRLLLNETHSQIVRKKHDVFREGNYPMALYYIRKGKVKTYKTNQDGREFITGLHGEGDFIGYLDLLENGDHSESAATLEDTELVSIHRQDFFVLLHRNQDVAHQFIKLLAKNLAEKEGQLLKLAYDSVRKRVAETLVSLHERFLTDTETPALIKMSREDLSSMIGASKETVIRTLSDFKEEKLIEITPTGISILHLAKLQKMRN